MVISLGFGTLMITSPTARAAFIRWVTEWYETHVTYRYAGDSISGTIPRYEITELPEGYFEYKKEESDNYTQIIYHNTVTWIDEEANLQFVLDAPFEQNVILRIAESVLHEENMR